MVLLMFSCSNQKNTKKSRLYHEINTRYNIYYNAEIAYEEALKNKNESYQDNLSQIISMYPVYPEEQAKLGGFETTIDKSVKAIKMHSIQAKPEKDPNKRRDIKYQEWFDQKEFNPFLKSVWLLMAKAEYESLDYVRAISTFSYITRLFKNDAEVVAEANLWMAKAYTQMGWNYEVENIFHRIKLAGGVPKSQESLYAEVYANYLLKDKKYEESIPYLQQAIKSADGKQKIRLKYLLGQVYAKTGDRGSAYKAFDDVQGMSTPHLFSLNAKLQQAAFVDPQNAEVKKKTLSSLNGMAGKLRNEEFLDQIYYAIGNIYWASGDTTNTLKNYHLAIDKSTRAGFDKAIAQVSLGDIYFNRKDYVKAQPLYPEALGVLGKKYERYDELSLRSEVLDELVVYAEALHLQDSLQTLAKMPEAERIVAINKIIELEKQKEKEEERKRAEEEWKANNPDERPNMVDNFPSGPRGSMEKIKFYFYNNQTVAQGKATFKRAWGNRKLEDNWRRQEKGSTAFDSFFDTDLADQATDSISGNMPEEGIEAPVEEGGTASTPPDKYSVEFYLAQLPLTPDKMRQSNAIIEDAYYQMANIYKSKLGDLNLAIEAYTTSVERFPQTKNKEEIYYQLFLIYSQLNNKAMADLYRSKLIAEFPTGDYAVTLSDPNYEWNMRNIATLENDLYNTTYEAYLANNVNAVRNNYTTAKEKFPLTKLMPKFMFVNALTYAQTNEPKAFGDNLKELIDKYPDADVTPLASDMLKGVLSGKSLIAGGPMRGMIWDIPFTGDDFTGVIDTTTTFVDKQDAPHRILLVFDVNKVSRNELLYDVANYNFSRFILKTFDLSFSEIPPLDILQIQGLDSFGEVADYVHKSFEDSSLISRLDSTIIMVPISEVNYTTLTRGRSLGEYIRFVESTYGKQLPDLIAYWKKQIQSTTDTEEERNSVVSKEEAVVTQPKKEEEPEDIIEPVLIIKPKDSVPVTTIPDKEEEETKDTPEKEEGLETIISDETIGKVVSGAKDVNKAIDDVMNNPVDGIKNLINKAQNKPKLSKEEKEELKKEKELQKQLDKERKAREKAAQDSIASIEKARQDSIKQEEKEQAEMEKAAIKAKEDARKDAVKAKEDARKARQQELKDKEKAREERLKQREKERREKERLHQQELKAKEKAREELLKQKEKEREEKRKQRERELREKNRNR